MLIFSQYDAKPTQVSNTLTPKAAVVRGQEREAAAIGPIKKFKNTTLDSH